VPCGTEGNASKSKDAAEAELVTLRSIDSGTGEGSGRRYGRAGIEFGTLSSTIDLVLPERPSMRSANDAARALTLRERGDKLREPLLMLTVDLLLRMLPES